MFKWSENQLTVHLNNIVASRKSGICNRPLTRKGKYVIEEKTMSVSPEGKWEYFIVPSKNRGICHCPFKETRICHRPLKEKGNASLSFKINWNLSSSPKGKVEYATVLFKKLEYVIVPSSKRGICHCPFLETAICHRPFKEKGNVSLSFIINWNLSSSLKGKGEYVTVLLQKLEFCH